MRTHTTSVALTFLLALGTMTQPGRAQQAGENVKEHIGIYDSRAVAVAYAGSAFQEGKMKELKARLNKAKEAGDAREVSRLETEGKAWQALLHQQGFGTAPVDDILTNITAELPKIRADAGVTTLVSKWNKAELDRHPKAEQVDVTMRLVDAFQPTAKQRKHAIEIQTKSPAKLKE